MASVTVDRSSAYPRSVACSTLGFIVDIVEFVDMRKNDNPANPGSYCIEKGLNRSLNGLIHLHTTLHSLRDTAPGEEY